MQNNLQHDGNQHSVAGVQAGRQGACGEAGQIVLGKIRENSARAQAQQSNRNGQKRKVVKEDDRKEPGER
jgi:hypothetical protein